MQHVKGFIIKYYFCKKAKSHTLKKLMTYNHLECDLFFMYHTFITLTTGNDLIKAATCT